MKNPTPPAQPIIRQYKRGRSELDDLVAENLGRVEADRNLLWRKVDDALAKNDVILSE